VGKFDEQLWATWVSVIMVYVNTLMLQDVLAEPDWTELLTSEDRADPAVLATRAPVRRSQTRHDRTPQHSNGRAGQQARKRIHRLPRRPTRRRANSGSIEGVSLDGLGAGDSTVTNTPRWGWRFLG